MLNYTHRVIKSERDTIEEAMKRKAAPSAHLYWIGGCTAATTLTALIFSMLVPLGPMFPALQLAGVFLGWVAAFIDQHSIRER